MIDELLLQKLVDGELSNDQIRALLHDVDQSDQTSATWKQLAVAFTENQIIQREFSELDSGFLIAEETESKTANDNGSTLQQSAVAPATSPSSASRTWWTFALAASLLIGLSLLYQSSIRTNQADDSSSIATQDSGESLPQEAGRLPNFDRTTLLTLRPDHQLESAELPASLSAKVRQQVPLYDANRFDKRQFNGLRTNDMAARRAWVSQVMPGSGVNEQMMADYEKAGMMVDQDIEFLSGRLDDGRAYMIPYRSVRFSTGQ